MMSGKDNIRELDLDQMELVTGGVEYGNDSVYVVDNSSGSPVVFKTYEKALAYCNNSGLPVSAIKKTTLSALTGGN